jgi:GNAT superfamily N-acetyltransferase
MEILQTTTTGQIAHARQLFREYAAWLAVDLCFQGFDAELANLPGAYALPRGRLLLAIKGEVAAGCVAVRPLDENVCEMKRLFVSPAFRGQGLGRRLAERVIDEARTAGYATIRLDTLPRMHDAIRLYRFLGFTPCPAYYETPLSDTIFMELPLSRQSAPRPGEPIQ